MVFFNHRKNEISCGVMVADGYRILMVVSTVFFVAFGFMSPTTHGTLLTSLYHFAYNRDW